VTAIERLGLALRELLDPPEVDLDRARRCHRTPLRRGRSV
jgi:hypothetical protein